MSAVQWVPENSTLGVTLPSGESASAFIEGESGSAVKLVAHMLGRSVLVGVGLYLAGARDKDLVKYSLAGAAAIEAFVLGYAWMNRGKS